MVYLIIGILLLLLYVFATPESIKGTVNIVLVVFAFVALLILLMLLTLFLTPVMSQEVQAAKAGFKTINGKTYYITKSGARQKGWLTLKGKKYYFNKKTGVQLKGWQKNNKGKINKGSF